LRIQLKLTFEKAILKSWEIFNLSITEIKINDPFIALANFFDFYFSFHNFFWVWKNENTCNKIKTLITSSCSSIDNCVVNKSYLLPNQTTQNEK